jgi:diaminopimelate epimerase
VYLLVEAPELAAHDVRSSVGDADGILQVRARGEGWIDVVIWNPDASRAEMSGNGTRIAARWLAAQTGATDVDVRVGGRVVRARMLGGETVEQDLGEVAVGYPEEVEGVRFTPVSVGNPHAVVIGDPAEITRIGPLLETHPRFPERTNVQVVRVEDDGHVSARVWERGVGETTASGTGAVAVAAATHGEGIVSVGFPGGTLAVRLEGGRAYVTGSASPVE